MDNRLDKLKQMHEDDPQDTFVLFAIAQEHQQKGSFSSSIEYYLKLKQLNPDYVGLYFHLAKAYESIENSDEAMATYDEGILIAQHNDDWHAESELRNAKMNYELEL